MGHTRFFSSSFSSSILRGSFEDENEDEEEDRLAKRAIDRHRRSESFQVFVARNFHRTKRARSGRNHLNLEEREAARAQVLDELTERHFRGVVRAVEHGFAGEKSPLADAVNATNQFARAPAFEAVRVAEFV